MVAAEGDSGEEGEGQHEAHEAVEELVEAGEILDRAAMKQMNKSAFVLQSSYELNRIVGRNLARYSFPRRTITIILLPDPVRS